MKPYLFASLFCCLISHLSGAELGKLAAGSNDIRIKHDGQTRRIIVTTPKGFGDRRRLPLLFCFHGAGGKADGMSRRWSSHADKRGLLVVSAEAPRPLAKWNFMDGFHVVDHDDVGFVTSVARSLILRGIADPEAIYATGHSSGGLFCYRLARESSLFAALAPMSCGMAAGAHDPVDSTGPVSLIQVIGDRDKSFHGSSNPKVTMHSAAKRIEVWRKFLECAREPVTNNHGKEISLRTYRNEAGDEVAICEVQAQGHFIKADLRDKADSLALEFMLRHKKHGSHQEKNPTDKN